MHRDFAEKQDLWNELGELWQQRQMRRRRSRLGFLALGCLLMAVALGCLVLAQQGRLDLWQAQGGALERAGAPATAPLMETATQGAGFESTQTLHI